MNRLTQWLWHNFRSANKILSVPQQQKRIRWQSNDVAALLWTVYTFSSFTLIAIFEVYFYFLLFIVRYCNGMVHEITLVKYTISRATLRVSSVMPNSFKQKTRIRERKIKQSLREQSGQTVGNTINEFSFGLCISSSLLLFFSLIHKFKWTQRTQLGYTTGDSTGLKYFSEEICLIFNYFRFLKSLWTQTVWT